MVSRFVLALGCLLAWASVPSAGDVQTVQQPARSLTAGDVAPPFTLTGSDGKTYRLQDYRDKQAVVIAWFARAFSAG